MSVGDRAGRWCLRVAALLLVVCTLTASVVRPAHAEDVAFTIDDERISESSGLAADTCGDRYWTANDSGDEGTAYALSSEGKVQGTLTYPASPVDVEAVAVHDCRLYLADIGDNEAERDMLTVYWFSDPEPGQERSQYRSYDFEYPDGAHDAETFMISDSGRFYVVTKEAEGGIYRAPSALSVQGVNELTRVGDAPAYVTDGVMVEDQMVLRTYVSVVVLDDEYAEVASTAIPLQRQGESISRTLDGEALLLGTEGTPAPVLQIPLPTTKDEVPPAASSPPATGSSESSGAPEASQATETESGTAGGERTLTWVALGIATGIAVVAAGLAFIIGGRRTNGRHTAAGAQGAVAAPRRSTRDESDGVEPDADDAYDDEAETWSDDNDEYEADDEDEQPSAPPAAVPSAAAPAAAPLVPDEDEVEDADQTRKRAGSRFDAFFRPRRGRHGAAPEQSVSPEAQQAPEAPDVEEEPEVPERPAASRSDLDPATRAWLDAAFDASRGESRPRRARDD